MTSAMKHAVLASMLVVALGWVQGAWAATSAAINLTVTPTCSKAITVTTPDGSGTAYDFQSVSFAGSTVSTQAIVVTNTSSCGETWSLQVTGNTGGTTAWSSDDTNAALTNSTTDKYHLYAAFAASRPTFGTISVAGNLVTQGSAVTCSGSTKFFVSGGTSCAGVAAAATANLWFGLEMPHTQTDASATQRTITATINVP